MSTPLENVTEAGGLLIDAVNQFQRELTAEERVAFRSALWVLGELERVIKGRGAFLVQGGCS